jgi:hypothetical protein
MPYITTTNIIRLKQFFWNVRDARSVERGIGGYYNADTTAVNTTSTTRVNLKTYTFTASAKTNKVRIRVYAYVSGAVSGSTIYLNINGTDVVPATVTATASTLYIDYIGDLTPNTSYTVKVDGVAESGYTLYVDKVYIIAGFGLTSTTSVSILTITLDTTYTDSYILKVNGNFVYRLGVRWWVKGNRKTTASASFSSTLANEIQSNKYNAGADDDGDNNAFVVIRTGDYPGDNGGFTISGNVGATGDTIIITGIYCQVVLRGNLADSLNMFQYWFLIIKEKGFASWSQELLSIDGNIYANEVKIITKNGYKLLYLSSIGNDVLSTLSFPSNDSPEITLNIWNNEDICGESYCPYVNVIILGV